MSAPSPTPPLAPPAETAFTRLPDPPAHTPEDLELLTTREEAVRLRGEVERLQAALLDRTARLRDAEERAQSEQRRGDTWQELALRGEERNRELTLQLERFRGFACSPWWIRLRGLPRPL